MQPVPNFRVENLMDCEAICIGDIVKSYDFEHRDDCFVIGQVTNYGTVMEGCERYEIVPFQRWAAGDLVDLPTEPEQRVFYPPINGTRHSFGGFTNFVQKLDEDQAAIWREKLRDHAEDLAGDHA